MERSRRLDKVEYRISHPKADHILFPTSRLESCDRVDSLLQYA